MKKLLNRNTKRGTQKKRGRRNTNTNTPSPERANPERAREKKSGGRRTTNQTSGGGGGQKRLNKPDKAKPNAYLSTSRTRTYLERGARMKIRDQWGLVNEDAVIPCKACRFVIRLEGPRSSIQPYIRQNSSQLFELGAQLIPSPKTIKRKNHHTCRHVLKPFHDMSC